MSFPLAFALNTLTKEEVVNKIRDYIKNNMYLNDEHDGEYSFDTYVDYDDEISTERLKKIFQDEITTQIQKEFDEGYHDFIYEWVREHIHINFPFDEFLKRTVCVDITVDTGDANYDFTLNSFYEGKINDLASTVWLSKQQGYSKTQLNKAYNEGDYSKNSFLESLVAEYVNECTGINALTFLVKMPLRQAIAILEAKKELEKTITKDERYCPKKIKDRKYLVLDKDVNCGLIDFWNGSGSLLELKLEKDVKLPIKFVHEISPDSCYKWGFKNIYGCDDSFYEESLIRLSL
jgi:hypothetical protein